MPDPEKKTDGNVLEPVKVTVIGTQQDDIPANGTLATTPKSTQPNLIVIAVQPIVAILVRFANSYLTMLVGLVTAGMATNIIPAGDFADLVLSCAKLSLAGAGLGFLKDLVTVFGRLENKFPLLTGSV